MVDEPRRYGFHATLKAPFHLSSACTEMQLIGALQNFAASGHVIPVIAPVIRMLSGFAATFALRSRCRSERAGSQPA
jgi:hypothetical protein